MLSRLTFTPKRKKQNSTMTLPANWSVAGTRKLELIMKKNKSILLKAPIFSISPAAAKMITLQFNVRVKYSQEKFKSSVPATCNDCIFYLSIYSNSHLTLNSPHIWYILNLAQGYCKLVSILRASLLSSFNFIALLTLFSPFIKDE